MRLFVIGATGKTGSEILDLARSRGHQVTAFVRTPSKLERPSGLTIVRGNALDTDALAAAMPGHDAVLSTVGPALRDYFRPCSLITEIASSTVQAMKRAGVERLTVLSSGMLFPAGGFFVAFMKWLMRHHTRDLRSMESILQSSGLEWTITRPDRLKKSREVEFRSVANALPPKNRAMSFRAVAAFMLEAAERGTFRREIVGLAR